MKSLLFAFLGTALSIGSIHCQWRDVDTPRSLSLSGIATGALQVGDVVELVCEAAGAVLDTAIITWTSQYGNVQLSSWPRDYSPASLTLPVTPDLHGAQFFCSVPFTDSDGGHYFPYTVMSPVARLTVAGVGSPYVPNMPGHVEIESLTGDTHRVGDTVAFRCTTYDMRYTIVDVIQAKGNYSRQVRTNVQPWLEVRVALSAADDGTRVWCRAAASHPADYRTIYTLVSNTITLHVTP